MEYSNSSLTLRYEAHGLPGYDPCLQLLVMRQGNAVFYRTEKTRYDKDGPDHFLSVSGGAIEKVKSILSEEDLYRLDSLERPAEYWGSAHTYDFYFHSGGCEASYCGYALEYIAGKKDCPKVNDLYGVMQRLGEVLIPEGVPAECFAPARKILSEPVRPAPGTVGVFPLYDFRSSQNGRLLGDPKDNERLEYYAFEKRSDGSRVLTVQMGWPGGTGHWDGAGNSYGLPEEWFSGSFEEFLDKLTDRYPAGQYGFSREELAGIPGLSEFLGFAYHDLER